jgi:hypothetical protein
MCGLTATSDSCLLFRESWASRKLDKLGKPVSDFRSTGRLPALRKMGHLHGWPVVLLSYECDNRKGWLRTTSAATGREWQIAYGGIR